MEGTRPQVTAEESFGPDDAQASTPWSLLRSAATNSISSSSEAEDQPAKLTGKKIVKQMCLSCKQKHKFSSQDNDTQ